MDILSMQEQIRRYTLRISELEKENIKLRTDIQRLDESSNDYQRQQQAFENYRAREHYHINEIHYISQIRIAESHAQSLAELCNGSQSYAVYDAFTGIQNTLAYAKQDLNDKIRSNLRSIDNFKQEISYLKNKIASLSMKGYT